MWDKEAKAGPSYSRWVVGASEGLGVDSLT
jgi:hypothetical protein